MRKVALSVLILSLTGLALPAAAAEGRIPVFAPGPLTAPGKYVLTRNITGAGTLIDIAAGDVDLDLNGFVVNNTGGGPTILSAGGNHNLRIRNGKVIGGDYNIMISQAQRVSIEDVFAIEAADINIFLDDTKDFAIRRAQISNPGAPSSEGIRATGVAIPGPTVGTIEDSIIEQINWGIVIVEAASVAVRNNRVHETSSGAGMRFEKTSALQVTGNTINFSGGAGIELIETGGSVIANNAMDQSTLAGVFVDDFSQDNQLRGNVVTNGQDHGIVMDGNRNHIEANVLNGNAGWGLFMSPLAFDNVYRANLARGNNTSGSPLCVSPPAKMATNDLCDDQPVGPSDNDSQGNNWMPFAL